MAALFQQYWYPLYAFARRRGNDHEKAQDLTQAFFVYLLEKGCLRAVDPRRGKFRSFLLTSFKNFLANEWDRRRALKRGGGAPTISMDDAQTRFQPDPNDSTTPETLFDREWALSLIQSALDRLENEMAQSGGQTRFKLLRGYLTDERPTKSYRDAARELELSESAVKVAVHRMRRRLGILLRYEVTQTVHDPALADEEIRYLLETLSR